MFIPYKSTLRVVIAAPIEEAERMLASMDTDPAREKVDRNYSHRLLPTSLSSIFQIDIIRGCQLRIFLNWERKKKIQV
jgi:hypothetical protein